MISAHSSNGIVFPGLRDLAWWVQPHTLPFYRLFLSPHLTEFVFVYLPFEAEVTDEVLSGMTSVILELETSPLRHLYLDVPATMSPSLNSAVSSAILRCGSSLDTLLVSTPLSDAAVQHIMGLPKFTSWYAMNGPPKESDLSLSDAFPQLEILELRTETSLEWIPILGTTPRRTSSGQNTHAPLHRGPGQNLTVLESCVAASVDAAFMSPIIRLHGLVELRLESSCSNMGGCTFSLTDGDVAEIAIALPNLVNVTFGEVCPADSCKTTVRSLLFLSTSCIELETLEIHFNTRNLRDDLESIPENPRLRGLCGLPRCRLEWLTVANAPLRIAEEDHGPVVAGFLRIFQSVERVSGVDEGWDRLSSRLCNQE